MPERVRRDRPAVKRKPTISRPARSRYATSGQVSGVAYHPRKCSRPPILSALLRVGLTSSRSTYRPVRCGSLRPARHGGCVGARVGRSRAGSWQMVGMRPVGCVHRVDAWVTFCWDAVFPGRPGAPDSRWVWLGTVSAAVPGRQDVVWLPAGSTPVAPSRDLCFGCRTRLCWAYGPEWCWILGPASITGLISDVGRLDRTRWPGVFPPRGP